MKPKDEYVIIYSENSTNSNLFGFYTKNKQARGEEIADGVLTYPKYHSIPYNLCHKFDNWHDAIVAFNKMELKLRETKTLSIIVDLDGDGSQSHYNEGNTLWLIKVKLEDYIGIYYAWAKSIYQYCKEHNIYYTNYRRYQIARYINKYVNGKSERYTQYLLVKNGERFWTNDRFSASFLTKDEQEKLIEQYSVVGEYPYCADNLPCQIIGTPRFEKGDIVYFFDNEHYLLRKGEVTDIMPTEEGYKFAVHQSAYANFPIWEENFYQGDFLFPSYELYTLDEINEKLKRNGLSKIYDFED